MGSTKTVYDAGHRPLTVTQLPYGGSGSGHLIEQYAYGLNGTVTRTVYVRDVADARRRMMRKSRMTAEFGAALRVALNEVEER